MTAYKRPMKIKYLKDMLKLQQAASCLLPQQSRPFLVAYRNHKSYVGTFVCVCPFQEKEIEMTEKER